MYMFLHSGHIVYIFTSFNIYKKFDLHCYGYWKLYGSLVLAYNVFF